MNPFPKKVSSVFPLDGTKAGLKKRGEMGQNKISALSFAKILENFLFSVVSVIFTGPLSKYF
jgi:hypothetical protein